jgi:glutamyl-tRNA reductase
MQDYAGIKKRSLVFIDKALPELTRLAMDLQPEQIAHLEKKFASNNEAYRKEYLKGNLEDRQLFRFKKVLKQAEYWFGNFTSEQEAQIRKASDARPLDNELWAEERRQRQQELLRILRKIQSDKPSKEAVSAMLRQYVERSFDNFTYAEHKDFFDGMRNGSANMVAVIANVATQEQREHARERLQKWIDDCRALAAK